jgi:hypothetical protein
MSSGTTELKPSWNRALPEKIPHPSAWPAGLAFGVASIFWGLIASPVILGIGLCGFAISLAGWIGDIRHE